MVTLHKILIVAEAIIVFIIAYFTDLFVYIFAGLSFISPGFKETLIDLKEVIGITTAIAILILTILRIKNENKKNKE